MLGLGESMGPSPGDKPGGNQPGGKSGNKSGTGGKGPGMGGPGQGKGGTAPEREHDADYKNTLIDGQRGPGPKIVGPFRRGAGFVKKEDREAFARAVEAEKKELSKAVVREKIPRHMRKILEEYFGGIQPPEKPEGQGEKPGE